MKQYIERSELVERINKYVELTNPEEQEWVKDECIRQAHAMPSVNVGGWISVAERLPEKQAKFLIADDKGNMEIALWTKQFGWFSGGNRVKKVTHWMTLPEPPKGD